LRAVELNGDRTGATHPGSVFWVGGRKRGSGAVLFIGGGFFGAAKGFEGAFDFETAGGFDGPGRVAEGAAAVAGKADGGEFAFVLWGVDAIGPVARHRDGPVVEQAGHGAGVFRADVQGTPAPIFGFFGEIGAEGIAFNVSAYGEKMAVFLYGEALESALVEVAAALAVAMGVPALGVGHGEPLHESRELAVGFWPEDEVEMIGHEAIGAYAHC
jgi:hypothetical protein